MEFKDRLKQLRTMRGLSQVALADRLDISKSTIAAYEIGTRMPGRDATRKMSEFFHVSPAYLMHRTTCQCSRTKDSWRCWTIIIS